MMRKATILLFIFTLLAQYVSAQQRNQQLIAALDSIYTKDQKYRSKVVAHGSEDDHENMRLQTILDGANLVAVGAGGVGTCAPSSGVPFTAYTTARAFGCN